MMTLALLLAIQDDTFQYSEWEAWNAFEAGSSVTMEIEAGGMKVKMTSTIKSKSDTEITLEGETEMNGMKVPTGERKVVKPSTPPSKADPTCPKCKKEHFAKPTITKEKVKVGDRELETTVMEIVATSCEGNELGRSKTWYSKDVPGWIVRQDATFAKSSSKQTCLAFDAKKK